MCFSYGQEISKLIDDPGLAGEMSKETKKHVQKNIDGDPTCKLSNILREGKGVEDGESEAGG